LTSKGKVPVPPQDGGVVAGVFKDSEFKIPLLIRASQKDEDISFIAAPRITTADDKSAMVKLSERREFLETVLSPEGTTTAVTSGGFNEAATELEITPHINEEGGVRMEIKTTVDQFLPSQQTSTGESLTRITEREAETEVTVEDSKTVVIGGLARQTIDTRVQRVPILGDIPLLGALFRRTTENVSERHLYIFITPRVHRTSESMAAEAERSKRRLESMRGQSPSDKPLESAEDLTGRDEEEGNQ
jgi:type II secretory pathway component GspD/PulD (secretin)